MGLGCEWRMVTEVNKLTVVVRTGFWMMDGGLHFYPGNDSLARTLYLK